jgi:hypothetical protein
VELYLQCRERDRWSARTRVGVFKKKVKQLTAHNNSQRPCVFEGAQLPELQNPFFLVRFASIMMTRRGGNFIYNHFLGVPRKEAETLFDIVKDFFGDVCLG